ncbi:MAG: response regulator [Burkholderiales bacterium]
MTYGNPRTIRLLLVDAHPMVRTGVRAFVSAGCNIEIVGECSTASDAITASLRVNPDVVLMDTQLPDGSGLDACRKIVASSPSVKVLILTSVDNDKVRLDSIFAGADGYLLKDVDAETLIDAIENVASGRHVLDPVIIQTLLKRIRTHAVNTDGDKMLSPQEQRIMFHVAEGKTNKEIGAALDISDKTVKNYLSNIFQKLHVTRRSEAAVIFARRTFK